MPTNWKPRLIPHWQFYCHQARLCDSLVSDKAILLDILGAFVKVVIWGPQPELQLSKTDCFTNNFSIQIQWQFYFAFNHNFFKFLLDSIIYMYEISHYIEVVSMVGILQFLESLPTSVLSKLSWPWMVWPCNFYLDKTCPVRSIFTEEEIDSDSSSLSEGLSVSPGPFYLWFYTHNWQYVY